MQCKRKGEVNGWNDHLKEIPSAIPRLLGGQRTIRSSVLVASIQLSDTFDLLQS